MNGCQWRKIMMKSEICNQKKYSAAIYVRLSKEDDKKCYDEDSESIINQIAILTKYAEDENIPVFDIYSDDGYTGTNTDRPAFQKMIKDIESGKVNMVITKDFSRLSRDRIAFGEYTEKWFPEHNVRYIAVSDDYDNINGCNNITAVFKSFYNEFLASDTSVKVSNVKHYKQDKGLFIGGKAPYGYKKSPTEKNVIVIDEPAAEIVRYIFKLALEGKSCREIAIILNDKNIPTPAQYAHINLSVKGPYSGKWSSERISFMLQNEVYIGSMVQGRVKKVSYKSKKSVKLPKDEWKVVENTHEPLIDKETFKKVSQLIKSRMYTRSHTYDYLLKGLIYCHECQKPLGVSKRTLANNNDVMYFLCRTYQRFTKNSACSCHCVRVDDVTNAVMHEVREVCKHFVNQLDLDSLKDSAYDAIQTDKRRQGKDLSVLKSNLDIIQIKIDKALNDRISGLFEEDDFQRVYSSLKDEQKRTRQMIARIESNGENEDIIDTQKIKELVEKFLESDEYSRELLVSLIERIELTKDKEILIFFRFSELELSTHL